MMHVRAAGLCAWLAMLWLTAAAALSEPRFVELAIRGGALPKHQQVVKVRQGDEVTLRWTSDVPLSIHVHGYDIEEKLSPHAPAAMRFTARATGRFPIELHQERGGRERTIGYLEVHPR
jgi:hypothetical protein